MDVLVSLLVEVVFVVAVVVVMIVVVCEVVVTNSLHVRCLSGPVLKRIGSSRRDDEEDEGGDEKEHYVAYADEEIRTTRTHIARGGRCCAGSVGHVLSK